MEKVSCAHPGTDVGSNWLENGRCKYRATKCESQAVRNFSILFDVKRIAFFSFFFFVVTCYSLGPRLHLEAHNSQNKEQFKSENDNEKV